jgi:hypothetical protein
MHPTSARPSSTTCSVEGLHGRRASGRGAHARTAPPPWLGRAAACPCARSSWVQKVLSIPFTPSHSLPHAPSRAARTNTAMAATEWSSRRRCCFRRVKPPRPQLRAPTSSPTPSPSCARALDALLAAGVPLPWAGSPWPSSGRPAIPCLRPSSTRTDRAIAFPVPRHPSRAPRLTVFTSAVDHRRSVGRQAVGCRGRTTTGLFGPSQGHQLGCGGSLVLVPPLAAAAGGPTSPEPRVRPPPCRRREVEEEDRPLCPSLSLCEWLVGPTGQQGPLVGLSSGAVGYRFGCA